MRPGCLILTATILRSSIKASRRQNIVHHSRNLSHALTGANVPGKNWVPSLISALSTTKCSMAEVSPWISFKPAPISGTGNSDRGDGELLGRVWLEGKADHYPSEPPSPHSDNFRLASDTLRTPAGEPGDLQ